MAASIKANKAKRAVVESEVGSKTAIPAIVMSARGKAASTTQRNRRGLAVALLVCLWGGVCVLVLSDRLASKGAQRLALLSWAERELGCFVETFVIYFLVIFGGSLLRGRLISYCYYKECCCSEVLSLVGIDT